MLSILENIITLGNVDFFRSIGQEDNDGLPRVAAGDPALSVVTNVSEYEIPETLNLMGRQIESSKYNKYLVTGNSMLPKGVVDGDWLLVDKSNDFNDYKEGDFLVIKVDKDYYKKYNPKHVKYDYKLRRALMRVTCGMTAEQIVREVKNIHFELNIESNQKYMSDKYEKARKAYPNDELMLSTTYHDGRICYSFHPIELIIGKASILVHIDEGNPAYRQL